MSDVIFLNTETTFSELQAFRESLISTIDDFYYIVERMGALKEAHHRRRELQAKAGLSLEDLEEELAAEWKMMEVRKHSFQIKKTLVVT